MLRLVKRSFQYYLFVYVSCLFMSVKGRNLMDGTAVLMRFGLKLVVVSTLVFVSACTQGRLSRDPLSSSNSPANEVATSEVSDIAQSNVDLANTAVDQANAVVDQGDSASRVLSSFDQGSLGIELVEGRNANKLVLNSTAKAGDFSVNRLTSPERIVIDIKGQKTASSRSYDTSDTDLISKIRVGSHPDMTRVVLDLATGANVEHQVNSEDGRIVVSLTNLNPSATLQTETQGLENSVARIDEDQLKAPVAELAGENASDAKASPKIEEEVAAVPVVATDKDSSESILNGVMIEQVAPDSNMVVAEISSTSEYNLEKTAPSEYVLKIKNTKIADTVESSVAPPNSGLIRSVRATSEGNDALVRIFAQPGSGLKASLGEGKIVVTASSQADYGVTATRAQIAPEKAEEKPADAKPATEVAANKPGEVTLGDEEDSAESELDRELEKLALQKYSGRKISLDLQDTDIDNALRIIAEVSNLNIIASDDVTGKVTLRLVDVPWDQALDVILKTNGLDSVKEGRVIRIAPIEKLRQERDAVKALKQQQDDLEPLQVRYIRVSYAKASELKPLVETVVTERGVVTYDERTNQLIIKDIAAGIKNVSELVSRIDLRTPQVLLETQIVEASRTLARSLGAELGFKYIQSVETGNSTGKNFPNSINFGGAVVGGANGLASSFPGTGGVAGGSAVSLLLGSADGAKNLDFRISSLENEGRIRVVSRPAVATTNNKQAVIKSIEKIRIKTPQGGLSVATGQGASASGSSAVATETVEVGITLQVTPQASPDYYVLLDIDAKSSNFGARVVDGIPSEIERSATSTVLVSSGQTFAMGGIYKISDQDAAEGVPFLKDIPFLGHLFRRTGVNNSDEELLFFITPRIVEGSFDDATMKVNS
jgi:type IV pilus assembly protein PilQ